MNKILLIIKREYLTRIKKKSFIIMTILSPVIFAAMMVVPSWLATQEDTSEKVIAIKDATGLYGRSFKNSAYLKYELLSTNYSIDKKMVMDAGYDAFLDIEDNLIMNPEAIQLYSNGQVTFDVKSNIEQQLSTLVKEQKLKSYQIENLASKLNELNALKVKVNAIRLDEDGSKQKSSAEYAMAIGMVSAILIYMFMLIYGTQVMRGVIEEKTNRIIEIVISSVKPFQLMMGKIIGIGLVALTQFFIWIFLTIGLISFIPKVISIDKAEVNHQISYNVNEYSANNIHSLSSSETNTEEIAKNILSLINDSNILLTLAFFIFYFIGGYLVYAALFAAIGSAIDTETETQQFVLPILIPLILSIYIAMATFRNPHGDLSFWFSMIPFTSPVVMMSRIPFDVPYWEILLSMVILTGSFVFFTWFAGRVYRTGILMYGKKVNYKEIWKWFIQSGK
jgi:ABC-2 type transport system permease protein